MKRRVEVVIGLPDGFETTADQEPPQADEIYCISFVRADNEEHSEDEPDGYTAQAPCLCSLRVGTEAWLRGDDFEDVVNAMEETRGECQN